VIAELDALANLAHQRLKASSGKAGEWPKSGPVISMSGKHTLSCFSQAKSELDAVIAKISAGSPAMTPWRVHDLRRTAATGLQKLGVRLEVTEAILNHISGSKAGVVAIYQLYDWADEKREAMALWAAAVLAFAKGLRPEHSVTDSGRSDQVAWCKFLRSNG
jgi:hypothetical protein